MPDQWTWEEVEEHLAAAGIIGKVQEHARKELTSGHKLVNRGHITVHYRFLELITHTEILKRRLCDMSEQYEGDDQ